MTAQPQRNSRHLLKRTAWPSDQSKGELRSPKDCLEKSTQNNCHHAGKPLKSLLLYMRNLLWLQIIDSLVFVLRMKAWTITLWLNTLQAYVLREIFTFFECQFYMYLIKGMRFSSSYGLLKQDIEPLKNLATYFLLKVLVRPCIMILHSLHWLTMVYELLWSKSFEMQVVLEGGACKFYRASDWAIV